MNNRPALTHLEPIPAGRSVIAFKDGCTSCAETIGYIGTITRVLSRSMLLKPSQPSEWASEWVYRVFLDYFGAQFNVRQRHLHVTGDDEVRTSKTAQVCELQFDSVPARNNSEIFGAYRLPRRQWDHFVFRKSETPKPNFQLAMPMKADCARGCILQYDVPKSEMLDQDYVLRAIAKIVGVGEWDTFSG